MDETRLPHAGGAEDGEQLAGAVGHGLRHRGPQPTQLALPPDHHPGEPARRRLGPDRHETDTPRPAPPCPSAPEAPSPPRPRIRGRAPASPRRAGSRPAAPPLRAARSRSPRRRSRAAPPSPSRPRPVLTPIRSSSVVPKSRISPSFSSGQAVAQLGRCPHGPQRVVLVQDGNAEHRHHRVADELLDRPPVTFDDEPAPRRNTGP